MRRNFTPSIVPSDVDETVYMVLDDLGELGRAWRETSADQADLESIISGLLSGQLYNPVRVIAFNLTDRTVDDVSADIARELQRRSDLASENLSSTLDRFMARHAGPHRQLALRLV